MSYELITSEMLYDGLFQGFKAGLDMLYPIVLPIIIGGIFIAVIKRLVKSFTYNYSLVTGSTKREAKKKAKLAESIIDLASAAKDLNDINSK